MTIRIRVLILAFIPALSLNTLAGEPVTIESLLTEMIDHESVARFPEPEFRLKQESSYNRASKTPDDREGWFMNHDFNSNDEDQNFIRIEENNGRREWVLMDHQGPGAIVRTWMPWRNQMNAETDTVMYIYLDGAAEPSIEGNMLGLFDGTGLIPYPLAHPSLRSAVSFFPIPYARSCKVTVNERPFFYQFTFREYPEGTPVKTFTMADFDAAEALTKTVGDTLLNPQADSSALPLASSDTLSALAANSIDLPAGPGSIRELTIKLGDTADPAVTWSLILQIEFDGNQTVWCPIGDFFGSGIGLNPFNGWFRTVAEDGTMSCRWVMPYRQSGKVSLVNLADRPVEATLSVRTGKWPWDDRSMYFNASWRGQVPVGTMPRSDWNYVTLKGRGVYVGDTLTIMNPVERWWGEGDEKIWVDGEDFPSIFGTGTEDYYGYSWGGRSTDFYEHPFHAQPFSHKYNKLNRKPEIDEKNAQGISTETRTRSLDTMPFGSSLQLDMEIWSATDCAMGYGVGVYWYGFADTTSNRKPDPSAVLAWEQDMQDPPADGTFASDQAFLEAHTDVVVLQKGASAIAVVPAYQGRVMTSTYDQANGPSFGWINRPVIEKGLLSEAERKGKLEEHIYIFGGEERFWLGPEGGQFGLYFKPGTKFEFADWQTPPVIDTEPFEMIHQTEDQAVFRRDCTLENYSGTLFDMRIDRTVRLLETDEIEALIGSPLAESIRVVGYETDNRLTNKGDRAWVPESGLPSIWILGMFNPSPSTSIVIPFKSGAEAKLGAKVNDTYFGKVPPEHLKVEESILFFKGDGTRRGKIGISPQRSEGIAASWDADGQVLTVVLYTVQDAPDGYVNSMWEHQEEPYAGDVINAYNDGSPEPGAPPLGPFYELETSSPAAAMRPGEEMQHIQQTIHLQGPHAALDPVARHLLGASLESIENKFR